MNAVLKYPGAKWSLAEWIIGHFPPHHSYLEPFFGSGAVLFNKPRSDIETINDLDGDVVNLFRCIRQDPEKLGRMVHYTPYSRQEYEQAYLPDPPTDPFDRAARFLIRCNQGYGFRTNEIPAGWKNDVQGRERAYAAKYWTELPEVIDQGGGAPAGRSNRTPPGGRGDCRLQCAECPDLLRPALCTVLQERREAAVQA